MLDRFGHFFIILLFSVVVYKQRLLHGNEIAQYFRRTCHFVSSSFRIGHSYKRKTKIVIILKLPIREHTLSM